MTYYTIVDHTACKWEQSTILSITTTVFLAQIVIMMHAMHAKNVIVNRLSLLPYYISFLQQTISMVYCIVLLIALGNF